MCTRVHSHTSELRRRMMSWGVPAPPPSREHLPVATAAPSLRDVLDNVFSLARTEWISDFLFRTDPRADAAMLSAPMQLSHAVTASIMISCVCSRGGGLDFDLELNWLAVPSFNVGPITAGVGVEELVRGKSFFSGNASELWIRWVRCNVTGKMLCIAENPAHGFVVVQYFSPLSSTRSSRTFMRFDYNGFKEGIRAGGEGWTRRLTQSLLVLNHVRQSRFCPTCFASPTAACGCKLATKRPAHPMDFSSETQNMFLHGGDFVGDSELELVKIGVKIPFDTRSSVSGGREPSVVARLKRWGLQNRLALLQPDPLPEVMPGVGRSLQSLGIGDSQCDVNPLEIDSLLALGSNADMDIILLPDCPLPCSATYAKESDSVITPSPASLVGSATTSVEVPQNAPHCFEHVTPGAQTSRGVRDGAAPFGEMETERTAVSHASVPFSAPARSSARARANTAFGEREKQASLRVQKNREAAARSNLKRKLRNKALVGNLAAVRQAVSELTAREHQLREENMRLRASLPR